ncbi:olfactory receptor 10A2-like [Varanus komodoensis]|uniref:olfactory receptor 10A2-like n=1 Tax=Varanus komodoensis TaxID=61221 RepID=UPI001CF78C3D|nr:olfactory receptor 10A2-like [Varanus komodoensis]
MKRMTSVNQTMMNEFILLAFTNLGQLLILLFTSFLIIYIATVMGNILIILLTVMDTTLDNPMYFFLRNLSSAEVGFISTIIPKMLVNLLSEKKTISLFGCKAQMYSGFFFGTTECFVLVAMAYDRFVAICNPLRYKVIMNRKLCMWLMIAAWASGFSVGTVQVTWLFNLSFCRSNEVSHFYCDILPVLQLACKDTYIFELFILIGTFIVIICPFSLILASYVCIIAIILRMPSSEGRWKAFSTCSSHIMVVILFYGTASLTHLKLQSNNSPWTKHLISLSYVIVTPMLNPIIYSLRNKDMKDAFWRLLSGKRCC